MAPLTFADTHNMVAFLSKSDASAGFDQVVDFLNAQVIQYALMVNITIYVSCIKQFWATVSIKKANNVVKFVKRTAWNEFSYSMASAVICLATGRKINFSTYIFDIMVRNVDSPSKFMMYPWFLQAIIDAQVDDMSSHNNQYTSLSLTQKVFANMCRVGKRFSGVETPLFATMLVQPQPPAVEEEDEVEVPNVPTPPSPTIEPSPPPQDLILTPPQAQHAIPLVSPQEEQPTTTSESDMTLLNTLIETCATLSQKGRIDDVSATTKEVNAAKPIVFDDEEVTVTMVQTLIKMKDEKARLLGEQISKWLHDEEVEQAAAKEN
nr:hypothetical protein [Tanacetum cinerariifolium]